MALSFAKDIVRLFRPVDIEHMKVHGVLLDSYDYMSDPRGDHAHAVAVRKTLGGNPPSMPPGGPYWTEAQLELFDTWMREGFAP
jgi:hypothetical protein